MAYTSGNDINVLQATDTAVVGAGAGDDRYVLSPNLLTANQVITISDTQGANTLQLIGGLTITSSKVAATSVQLVLSNGATVNVLGADSFTFQIGGDGLSGVGGTKQTFAQFAASLGVATLPTGTTVSSGSANVGVNTDGTTTTTGGGSSGGFTLASSAVSVDEGKTVNFTLTAPSTSTSDRSFEVVFAGSTNGDIPGINKATADDVSGVGAVVIKAGETKGTLTVTAVGDNVAEGFEGFMLTALDSNFKTAATSNTVVIKDATVDKVLPVVKTGQIINFAENQAKNAVLGTVTATDETVAGTAGTISTFEITAGNADGFFAIGADGKITLTEAGAAAGKASNDYETAPNTFTIKVQATDAAGNKSTATDVVLNVTDVDDVGPKLAGSSASGTTVKLNFDEALKAAVISNPSAVFTVSQGSTSFSVNTAVISGNTVTLTLAATLAAGDTNIAYNGTVLEDALGNKTAAIASTKVTSTDTTAPTLSSSNPADNATSFGAASNIELTFSENVVAGTGNITIVNTGDATDTRTINVKDTTQVTVSANKVTINPTADLKAGSAYAVNVANSAILDAAGNAYAGIADNTTLNFTAAAATVPGTSKVFSTLIDTLVGDTGDDTFIGDNSGAVPTVTAGDQLDGGAGVDTLKFYTKAGTAVTFPTHTNVEKIYISGNDTSDVNVSAFASVTHLEINAPGATKMYTLGAGDAFALSNDVQNAGAGWGANVVLSSADTATTVTFDGVGKSGTNAAVDLKGTSLATVNTTATGKNYVVLNNTASATVVKTINIDGAGTLVLDTDTNALTGVTTINAANNMGGVTIDLAASNLTFTGGSGNDEVQFDANELTADDKLTGGAGTDVIQVADTVITSGASDVVKGINASSGFETLALKTAGSAVDFAVITSGITNARIDTGANTYAFTNATNSTLVSVTAGVTVGANNVSIANKLGETTTSLKMNATSSGASSVAQLVLTGVNTVNVESAFSGTGSQATANTVTLTGQSDNTQFNVTGNHALNLTLLAAATSTGSTVNASSLTGALTLVATNKNDALTGGSGKDTITAGTGVDTITGGAGSDKFVFASADLDTAAGAVTDVITDFVSGADTIGGSWGAASAANYLEAAAPAADLASMLAAADAALTGTVKYYVGQVGGDSYLVTDDDYTGYTEVIKLTGVTLAGIAQADIVA